MIKKKKVGSILLAGFLSLNLISFVNINSNAVGNEFKCSNIKSFGGSDWDNFASVTETSDGGFIAVGHSKSTDIEGFTPKGESDGIIVKYDSNGNQQWLNSFGGNKSDYLDAVTETSDGGFIAVGHIGSTDIEGITFNEYYDAIIIKYDSNGNQQWFKSINGNDWDEFASVTATPDGGVVVVGYSYSTDIEGFAPKGFEDGIIIKYDSNGNQQWFNSFGGNQKDVFTSVVKTSDGGFVTVGYSNSTNIEGFGANGVNNGIIVKYDSNGTQKWAKNFAGNNDGYLNSIIETSDNGFIVVGYSYSTDIEGFNNKGKSDGIIVKYDSSGNQEWVNSIGGSDYEKLLDVSMVSDGGFVVIGSYKSTDIEGLTNKGKDDSLIAKYDESGNQEWIKSFSGSDNDSLSSITEISNGEIIAVGSYSSTDIEGLANKGFSDIAIITYKKEPKLPEGITTSKDLNIQVVADNTLEMALSTNQISFSGYNGTEDLINNDLNITVSSGLNYDLFAKLNDELRGTNDIEAIIDKSNLKIKTLQDSDYKEFANINENITLVSNATNGKNNIHNINFKLLGDSSVKADTYNTSITFEAVQK